MFSAFLHLEPPLAHAAAEVCIGPSLSESEPKQKVVARHINNELKVSPEG